MRIVCVGGGPAGLYFAIQMKRRDPSHRITVIERNRPYDTFGWGVVFSNETLRNLEGADPESTQEILDSFAHWDDIDIHFKGRVITSGGHGFAASSASICSTSCSAAPKHWAWNWCSSARSTTSPNSPTPT